MANPDRVEEELSTHPDMIDIGCQLDRVWDTITQLDDIEGLHTLTTPTITVHTVPAVYHGEAVSVTAERIVIHTGNGLVTVALHDIVAITP